MEPNSYVMKTEPLPSVLDFFQDTLSKMDWKIKKDETVMDVGCGPGQLEKQLILPMFPNIKKLLAVDLVPKMIDYAKAYNSHPKIEYGVADIEDWKTIEKWEESISYLFSIHCFQLVKNQKQAFQNVHRLLKPGGKAAICMVLQGQIFDAVQKIYDDPKWKKYFKNVHNFVPESHIQSHHAPRYEKMLHELGFSILHIKEGLRADSFPSDLVYKNFFGNICVLVPHVPVERREEFKEDLFQYLIRAEGRSSEGLPIHVANMLELVIERN